MTDDRPIQLILDASALHAYGRHETVGEVIGEIDAEVETFATTTAALAEAVASGADRALIDVLRANTGCLVVPATTDWARLGRFMDLTRPAPGALHDLADSDLTWLAVDHRAFILTDRPDRYTRIFPGVATVQLEKPWSE